MFAGGTAWCGLRTYEGSEVKLNINLGSPFISWLTSNNLVNLSEPQFGYLVRLMTVDDIKHILNKCLVLL